MKPVTFMLLFLLFSSYCPLTAQEKTIRLNLKEGQEYVFEKTERNYYLMEDGTEISGDTRTRKIRVSVEKIVPGKEVIVGVIHLKNFREFQGGYFGIKEISDYFYPDFRDTGGNNEDTYHSIESLLCMFKIRFSINLQTSEIKVANREELLEEFHRRLKEQGLDDKTVDSSIKHINEKELDEQTDLISFLVWFHNTSIGPNSVLQNSSLNDKPVVLETKNNMMEFGNKDSINLVTGKWQKKYWVNTDNGMITNYSAIQRVPSNSSQSYSLYNYKWYVHETNIRLVSSGKTEPQKLTISGKIQNPLSKILYIRFLDQPFGEDLKKVTAILNNNGEFSATFDFSKKGLVYVSNENNNKNHPPATYVFYAEPGDSLHFESSGDNPLWGTTFSGDRVEESKLLRELREKIKTTDNSSGIPSSWSNVLFDRDIYMDVGIDIERNGKLSIRNDNVHLLIDDLKQTEEIAEKYKTSVSNEPYNFIVNETKAALYSGIFRYTTSVISLRRQGISGFIRFFNRDLTQNPEQLELPEVPVETERLNVDSIYNDYGLQSRKCVNGYLDYLFNKTKKVVGLRPQGPIAEEVLFNDIEQQIQFDRMVLAGSPLYRAVGDLLNTAFVNTVTPGRMNYRFSKETVLHYLNLMVKRCNDPGIVQKVKFLLSQKQKVNSGDYIPDIKFLDMDSSVVSYNHFFGEKPTLFYLSSDWAGDRYDIKKYAMEHPNINFVMAVEGDNYREWKEYIERSQPVANQLLFINDSITFKVLFLRSAVYLVFDKKGKFLGYGNGLKDSYQKAEQSLHPQKKEVDKSALMLIILILGILLVAITLTLLIWKWRVKRRLRKEKQFRRLRELELTAIRSQMNPHFLFNCLNSVQNLVQQNKGREAHLYLADFAGLIRKVLRNSGKEEVSLQEELDMVQQYLNLEKLRFDFEYTVSTDPAIDTQNTMVPSMLLQPFAENAVIHGLQPKSSDRSLKIMVSKVEEGLEIQIEDNGIGLEAAKKLKDEKNGKGIKMNMDRLELLREKYGEKYRLSIAEIKNGHSGTRVEIIIPEEK